MNEDGADGDATLGEATFRFLDGCDKKRIHLAGALRLPNVARNPLFIKSQDDDSVPSTGDDLPSVQV